MRVVLAVSALLLLSACPPTGLVCRAGTSICNAGCIDPMADQRNCGACGSACGASQVCVQGVCTCGPGTDSCGGQCVVTATDSRNCGASADAGACGHACGSAQVCEAGACRASCTAGVNVPCNGGCVDTASDPANCGACGLACSQGQSCRSGACRYDLVAACYWTGQAVRFDGTSFVRGTLADLGSNPAALAVARATGNRGPVAVLAADGQDRTLYQATVSASGLEPASRANRVGAGSNQVVVDGRRVYVVNSMSGTLQVLEQGEAGGVDVLSFDAGVTPVVSLRTVGELNLGTSTSPEGVAVAGGALWVPLWGGSGAEAARGQAVAKVGLSDAGVPTLIATIGLQGLDLQAFDGGSLARPFAVVAHRGGVYVVLNNLTAVEGAYYPGGPGLLARLEPSDGGLRVVQLAGTRCLNPKWAAEVGDRLAVSCGGRATYDSSYALTGLGSAGMVLLDGQDQLQDFWPAVQPTDGGAFFLPGRFAVGGSRLFLGDESAGRVVVLDVSDAGLTEVRGVGTAVPVCPVGAYGFANVSDLVWLP
jgi:hypothetical protein